MRLILMYMYHIYMWYMQCTVHKCTNINGCVHQWHQYLQVAHWTQICGSLSVKGFSAASRTNASGCRPSWTLLDDKLSQVGGEMGLYRWWKSDFQRGEAILKLFSIVMCLLLWNSACKIIWLYFNCISMDITYIIDIIIKGSPQRMHAWQITCWCTCSLNGLDYYFHMPQCKPGMLHVTPHTANIRVYDKTIHYNTCTHYIRQAHVTVPYNVDLINFNSGVSLFYTRSSPVTM